MVTVDSVHSQMLIGGAWVDSIEGRNYKTVNPATEELLGSAPQADPADMRRAIDAARTAFDEGPWPTMPRAERYRIIRQIAEGMERHEKVLSDLVVAETGTTGPLVSQMGSVAMMHDFAELAMTFPLDETVAPQSLGGRLIASQVLRQPVGVCGLLPTWNLPIMIAVRKLGPALASGSHHGDEGAAADAAGAVEAGRDHCRERPAPGRVQPRHRRRD